MKHFELAEWTDFVRGLVEKSARLPMEHHLASGCRKCRHTADLLRKLVGKRLGSVPVQLLSGKQVLAQATSNSLGEFQMEYEPSKHLRLYVPVRQAGKRVDVSPSQPVGRKTRGGSWHPVAQRRSYLDQ